VGAELKPVTPKNFRLPGIDLVCKIGEGGMSQVWKAVAEQSSAIVAVKILNGGADAPAADVQQFKAEEQAMEEIDHPGIVKSYGLQKHDGFWYYVMEYVDGYNFGSLLMRKQHLKEEDCLLICESVSSALDYAWNNHGIVHCDIKPENIMINTDGVVKLTDLGLCYTFKGLEGGVREASPHVLGTPAYISPEQVYGDLEPDCRADIYSLAASLYHLSTGRVLFPHLGNEGMMRAHCDENSQAKDPRLYRPELSEGFCQMLEAMLVKNRDERIGDWADVYAMCGEIEKGTAFKPRQGGPSSLALAPAEALQNIRRTWTSFS